MTLANLMVQSGGSSTRSYVGTSSRPRGAPNFDNFGRVTICRENVPWTAFAECGFQTVNHPAYSVDVARSDNCVLSGFKRSLCGKRFNDDDELRLAADAYFDSKPVEFWHEAVYSLECRWQRVVESFGEYID